MSKSRVPYASVSRSDGKDVDPLADSVPPRHALESDEEDELNPLIASSQEKAPTLQVELIGNVKSNAGLVIASGDLGKHWARGANLGEQAASVFVNKTQIGLVFNPSWTDATVIVSEVFSRLPLWAMSKYAKTIIDSLKPTSVALLDIYPASSYISLEALTFQNSPIRFLSTEKVPSQIAACEPFSPPNLLQGTSAAFLALLATLQLKGTSFLVPYPIIPRPAPKIISPSDFSHNSDDLVHWPTATIQAVHELAFSSIGSPSGSLWEPRSDDGKPSKRNDVDMNMYI